MSLEITSENQNQIMEMIRAIEERLIGLIGLTEDERSTFVRLGDKNLAHVQKALGYAEQNPHLIPNYIQINEWRRDLQTVTALTELLRHLNQLTQKLEDSLRLAGDEAYGAASAFYKSVMAADQSGIPGAKAIYNDLAARFTCRRGTKSEPINQTGTP
jgi:hypothetical protein